MKPIYLDYAATTPVDPRVGLKMQEFLYDTGNFANAASVHALGRKAQEAIEEARVQVANAIGAQASEIIWTSGATEAINLALKGVAGMYATRGKHIITVQTEHKAVLDTCFHLEKSGFRVSYLPVEPNGLLNLQMLADAIEKDTLLVSVMAVNNETGVMQDLAEIAKLTTANRVLLHVDAAQAIGKMLIDVQTLPIDLISMTAHKIYGPKGVGALYLRKKPRVRVEPLFHGGGQEQGMRSGTLPTHQIAGMGLAFALAQQEFQQDYQHCLALREAFLRGIENKSAIKINVAGSHVVPHILNVRCEGMLADAVLARLPNIAASTGSACQAQASGGSHVLRAMGLSAEEIKASIRFSFGRCSTLTDVTSLSTCW